MAADDLTAPLGQDGPAKAGKRWALRVTLATTVVALLGLVLAVFFGWAIVASDPMGGEPSAVVALAPGGATAAKSDAVSTPNAAAHVPAPAAPSQSPSQNSNQAPSQSVVTIIDGSTGKRQEVAVSGSDGKPSNGDQRMLESTRHGLIPRIATDGTRPAEAYARAVPPGAASSSQPHIAIVVTGLGVGAKLTNEAIGKLPGPVTLAFTPYGADIDRIAAKAREAGHELLLQVPMEPFDYPDSDPGPQALLTSLTVEQNTDRLYWLMSRFQGYVGLANYMGSRFTAAEAAFAPMLKETAKRGLIFFDDGGSQRSLAAQIAGANNQSFARADVVLDAVPTPAEMAKAFAKLEAAARVNGVAVGVASALPVSIERIAQWAKTAESRGLVLVPISFAATRSKSS